MKKSVHFAQMSANILKSEAIWNTDYATNKVYDEVVLREVHS